MGYFHRPAARARTEPPVTWGGSYSLIEEWRRFSSGGHKDPHDQFGQVEFRWGRCHPGGQEFCGARGPARCIHLTPLYKESAGGAATSYEPRVKSASPKVKRSKGSSGESGRRELREAAQVTLTIWSQPNAS